jgi:hypothetical protein
MSRASEGFKEGFAASGYAGKDEGVYDVYDVFGKIPDAQPFPVDAMPTACQRLAREASAAIGCPVDLVALPMLVTLGAAIGNARRITLKGGWEESTALYGTVIAPPGGRKHQPLKKPQGPL